jgi:hypothetical protein
MGSLSLLATPAWADETAALGAAFNYLALVLGLPALALLAVAFANLRGEASRWSSLVGLTCAVVGGIMAMLAMVLALVDVRSGLVIGGVLPGLMGFAHFYRLVAELRKKRPTSNRQD